MCGIFGAVGYSIDELLLQEIAGEALRRGPQAYGIAWIEGENICLQLHSNAINPKRAFKGIKTNAIIGNCRLATSGSFTNTANNQPIWIGDTAISHNGNVRSYLQIAEGIGAELKSECDSEIICHLVNRFGVKETITRLSAEEPMALLILQDNKITAFRKGQPLYALSVDGCHYLCSREFTGSKILEEGVIVEFGG